LEVDFFRGALQKVKARHRERSGSGEQASTTTSGTGFTLIAGEFSTVDYPGAGFTEAIRVNEAGQLVGSYILAGQHVPGNP
jgi:hypothetical protein